MKTGKIGATKIVHNTIPHSKVLYQIFMSSLFLPTASIRIMNKCYITLLPAILAPERQLSEVGGKTKNKVLIFRPYSTGVLHATDRIKHPKVQKKYKSIGTTTTAVKVNLERKHLARKHKSTIVRMLRTVLYVCNSYPCKRHY